MANQIPLIIEYGIIRQATVTDQLVVGGQPLAFKDRSTHTGTQLANTISDFSSAVTTIGNAAYQPLDSDLTAIAANITAAGHALLDDVDAAAQRATLGLGTLATQSGTFSGFSEGTNTGDQINISGNAATVTTNANLTGHVTSVGNTTVLGSFTIAQLNTAINDGNVPLSTSDLTEGSNQYFTEAKVLGTDLLGFVSGIGTITATDTVLSAINKLDANRARSTHTGTQTASTISNQMGFAQLLAFSARHG